MIRKNYILGLICLFSLTSCGDWLDVTPYGQVEPDKMLKEEKGFMQMLTGTYTLLNSSQAYGMELTVGFPEEIVHYWKKKSEFYNFRYTDQEMRDRLDATWLQLYKAIANTNLLLEYLNGKNPEDYEHYNLIRGEALGLRAYLHLDLLRLFGPVLKEGGMNRKAIPYHEVFSNQIVHVMTASEVLNRIQRDLDTAYVCLQHDPIKTYGRQVATEDLNKYGDAMKVTDLAFNFRGIRMNYYAVCATLARMYMLKEDYTNALRYANEVITSEVFSLVKREDMASGSQDLMFQRELIWGVYYQEIANLTSQLGGSGYDVDKLYLNWVYSDNKGYGDVEDYRLDWWETTSTTPAQTYLYKYNRKMSTGGSSSDITPWEKLLPMIRLSEMYYIAAEAYLPTQPEESWNLLNKVRASRRLGVLPDNLKNNAGELLKQLEWEYRKDYWGEGKLFYFYKRLNRNVVTRTETIPASQTLFELPLPSDEIEFGNNVE